MSESICVCVYLCVIVYLLTHVHVWMHVCMNELYVCVSGKTRIQVQMCLMQSMHSYTTFSQLKKRKEVTYFCLTSAKFFCVHCLNWIKKRCTESSIYRSRHLPKKWKWRGLEVGISFMYVTPARREEGGGEGGEGEEKEHVKEVIPFCIYHPFIKKSQSTFWYFLPNFPMWQWSI